MKQTILYAVLILLGTPGKLWAQCNDMQETKADKVFNVSKYLVRHRHIAYLENANKMTIELFYLDDYPTIKNVDSIVKTVMQEIAFYKDSLENLRTENVRIDYAYTRDNKFKKMRFTKHGNSNSTYVSANGNVSGLKLGQDTIRIKIVDEETSIDQCPTPFERFRYAEKTHPVQITFVLNSYTDINELISRGELNGIKDTFITRINAEKSLKNSSRVSTIFYNPVADKEDRLVLKKDYLLDDSGEDRYKRIMASNDAIVGGFSIGAGLVRNNLVPAMNFGLALQKRLAGANESYRTYGIYASPYYFFNKQADGKYSTYISWFITAEMGKTYGSKSDSKFGEMSFDLGYLINPDNSVFQKNTVKAFYNFTFHNGLTISPGMIATNNFRNFLPSITFRFFGIR